MNGAESSCWEGACVALKQTEDPKPLRLVVIASLRSRNICLPVDKHISCSSRLVPLCVPPPRMCSLPFHPELLFILKTWSSVICSCDTPGEITAPDSTAGCSSDLGIGQDVLF